MSDAFLKSVAFGIAIAAAIGPIALLIISTAASHGLRSGCYAALGAALADLFYALLAFSAGALILPLLATWAAGIRAGAAATLIGFSIWLMRQAMTTGDEFPAATRPAGTLITTFLLTLVNPVTLVIFTGFVPQLPLAGSLATAAGLALGLFSGSLSVQLALAVSGWLLGAGLPGPAWRRSISIVAAAGILVFGLIGLSSSR
ncbi:MAG: LysE family transporter [Steroidobacteraceae bacterium]